MSDLLPETQQLCLARGEAYVSTALRLAQELEECYSCEHTVMVPRLTRALTLLLKIHFSDAHNYGEYAEQLKCVVHDLVNPADSKVNIAAVHTYQPGAGEKIYGVFVEVRGISSKQIALGNAGALSDDTAYRELVRKKTATVAIHCEAPDTETAAIMAETAMDFLLSMSEAFSRRFGLLGFNLTDIQPYRRSSSPAPAGRTVWSFGLEISYPHRVFAYEESHRIKTIMLEVTREYAQPT